MEIILAGMRVKFGDRLTFRWNLDSTGRALHDDGATYILAGVTHSRYDGKLIVFMRYLPESEYPTLEFGRDLANLLTVCLPDRVCSCGKCNWAFQA